MTFYGLYAAFESRDVSYKELHYLKQISNVCFIALIL